MNDRPGMSAQAIKQRVTHEIKAMLDRTRLVGPDWEFKITEPHPNTLQVRVTAPGGVIRYHFEIRISQKV